LQKNTFGGGALNYYEEMNRQPLGKQAYDSIRDQIVTIKLEPGQMVYESELAAGLGMSRTPIREAIRMLIMEGLIEVLPQKGTRIMLISESKVEEARFVRESLEISAFHEIARTWRKDEAPFIQLQSELEKLLHVMEQAAEQSDVGSFLNADEAFHNIILRASGNQTLIQVIYNMRGHINRVRYLGMNEFDDMAALAVEHRQIFQALCTNNVAQVVSLMTEHLRRVKCNMGKLAEQFPNYFG
jgi:GntR family transcriptional regulator, rspAB operon transcriptional repressor